MPDSVGRAARAVLEVVEQQGLVTLATLAEVTCSHENTVRAHLQTLQRAGLVRRVAGPSHGRGRPPWLYSVVPARSGPVAEYAGLARTLAGVLHRTSTEPFQDGVAAGIGWGHELAGARHHGPDPDADEDGPHDDDRAHAARGRVVALFDEMGFAPESDPEHRTVRLPRCPLLDAAREYPDVVCGVHLGIAKGALRENGADDSEAVLLPFSEPGACRLHLASR